LGEFRSTAAVDRSYRTKVTMQNLFFHTLVAISQYQQYIIN